MSVEAKKLTEFLDWYLRIGEVPDFPTAFNGLQVETTANVSRVLTAVDASQASVDAAVAGEYDLLLVHHGLFWAGSPTVSGRNYSRLAPLIKNDIGVYSAHIPLDLHPEVGNNVIIANMLELVDHNPFGQYEDVFLGIQGASQMTPGELNDKLEKDLGCQSRLIRAGSPEAGSVAVVSGSGGSFIEEAARKGIGTLITGEASHHSFFEAEESGVNLILAGHYATETVGVKALAGKLCEEFDLEWEFFDHPTGL